MKPIRIDGHRVPCAVCKDHWATAPVFHTVLCGRCLRAFFVGYMTGSNACSKAIYDKYDLVPKKEALADDRDHGTGPFFEGLYNATEEADE